MSAGAAVLSGASYTYTSKSIKLFLLITIVCPKVWILPMLYSSTKPHCLFGWNHCYWLKTMSSLLQPLFTISYLLLFTGKLKRRKMLGIMKRPTSSSSRVIMLLRLIAVFLAGRLQCPTITAHWSHSNPCKWAESLNATWGAGAFFIVLPQSREYCPLVLVVDPCVDSACVHQERRTGCGRCHCDAVAL